jgi:group I intron endonuclease
MINKISGCLISPDMKHSGVYLIVNLYNQKYYIGSARNLASRKRNHFNELSRGVHRNTHLQRSYNSNPQSLLMVLVEEVDEITLLTQREQWWMDELNVTDKTICYNVLNQANSLLGFKHSDETRAKISEGHTGKTLSHSQKEKISISLKGNKRRKGKPASNKKPVVQMNKKGFVIKTWESITEAANCLALQTSHIHSCCSGKRKTHGGFLWEFEKEVLKTN